jgi:curli biogenesis system outer membrane secretion channel CsgG
MLIFFRMPIIVGLMLATASVVSAQNKVSVGILPFTYASGSANVQDVASIQEEVTNAFIKTKRFIIVDRSKMDALKGEKELQKTEDFIDASVVEQGKNLAVEFLVSGHVAAISADEFIMTDSKTGQSVSGGWKAKLTLILKIIDVATGEVTKSETIEPKTGSALSQMTIGSIAGPTTREAAIAKSIKDIDKKIDEFVAANFPLSYSIVEFQDKGVMIHGGSDVGLKKGQELIVYEVSTISIDGKDLERKKEIGKLKISKVENENFSICDIKSGDKEIKDKFEAKANLKILRNVEKRKINQLMESF